MATSSSLRTLLRILVLTYSKSVLGDWRASLSIWSKDIYTKRWPRRVGGGSRLRKSGLSMTVLLVRRQEPRWLASHGAMITWPNILNTGWRERLLPRRRTAVASSDLRSDSGTALVWSISACLVPNRRCRPTLHETQPPSLRGARQAPWQSRRRAVSGVEIASSLRSSAMTAGVGAAVSWFGSWFGFFLAS
jgi:hypothetical protein